MQIIHAMITPLLFINSVLLFMVNYQKVKLMKENRVLKWMLQQCVNHINADSYIQGIHDRIDPTNIHTEYISGMQFRPNDVKNDYKQ